MIYIIRNSDSTIKTFAERGDDFILQQGETIEINPAEFGEYASRFTLTAPDHKGDLIRVKVGSPQVKILVSCPGQLTVDVDLNGTVETLQLTQGTAEINLSTAVPGLFTIQPADRHTYCSGGNATLYVEVQS